jgi:hypothetical protein
MFSKLAVILQLVLCIGAFATYVLSRMSSKQPCRYWLLVCEILLYSVYVTLFIMFTLPLPQPLTRFSTPFMLLVFYVHTLCENPQAANKASSKSPQRIASLATQVRHTYI